MMSARQVTRKIPVIKDYRKIVTGTVSFFGRFKGR
jgi:hypothetical protein